MIFIIFNPIQIIEKMSLTNWIPRLHREKDDHPLLKYIHSNFFLVSVSKSLIYKFLFLSFCFWWEFFFWIRRTHESKLKSIALGWGFLILVTRSAILIMVFYVFFSISTEFLFCSRQLCICQVLRSNWGVHMRCSHHAHKDRMYAPCFFRLRRISWWPTHKVCFDIHIM